MASPADARILIVDDEEELLHGIASYFRYKGETVETAKSFHDGLNALDDRGGRFNVLISDARMPDGSGIDLIGMQLARQGDSCLCVLMTGQLEKDHLKAGFDRVKVFAKPFSLSEMYKQVRAQISGAAPRLPLQRHDMPASDQTRG